MSAYQQWRACIALSLFGATYVACSAMQLLGAYYSWKRLTCLRTPTWEAAFPVLGAV